MTESAVGQAETGLREAISLARQRVQDAAMRVDELLMGRKVSDLKGSEKERLQLLKRHVSSTVEDYLNAYEDACGKYIDRKIDRQRFKKTYIEEIKNLCDPNVQLYAEHMHPKATSKYEAIWKIYDEWHRHEK